MNTCKRCAGSGIESWFEDGRHQQMTCYHCSGGGEVDDETDYQDRLGNVAGTLAYMHVCEMKDRYNSDPEGEGWDFRAAENMMSSRDYFDMHVYDYTCMYAEQLADLPVESQRLLIAWNESPRDTVTIKLDNVQYVPEHLNMEVWAGEEDNLCF